MSGKWGATVGAGQPTEDRAGDPRDSMVGPTPQVHAKIAGKDVLALVDSRSQVTMISEGLFNKLFGTKKPLAPLGNYFTITSANALEVPYIGYFQVDVEVNGMVARDRGILVKENTTSKSPDVILGTNVLTEFGLLQLM